MMKRERCPSKQPIGGKEVTSSPARHREPIVAHLASGAVVAPTSTCRALKT
uniref:Bm13032 n=1 Tax=Brugia malayi TaxID=6279 RepID=A0A1I9GBT3_BRUMA|nr:Bm13032 [Brugia malayi]